MQTFTPGQIQKAYERADSRIIEAIHKVSVDQTLAKVQQAYMLPIDRVGEVRTMVDFVLIGLMTAKAMSASIGELFPEHKDKIIADLNRDVFKPVLEYVRTHEPEDFSEPEEPKDAFASSNIELVDAPEEGEDTHPMSRADERTVLAQSGIELDDEEDPAPMVPPKKPSAGDITEEIEGDPASHITYLEHIPDKPGASKPAYHQDPYHEPLG